MLRVLLRIRESDLPNGGRTDGPFELRRLQGSTAKAEDPRVTARPTVS